MRPKKVRLLLQEGHLGEKHSEPITDVPSDGATDKQLEDICRRGECRSLEREGQRRHVFNGWRSEDKKKAKTFGTVSAGQSQGTCKSWRGPDPREPVFPRKSISQSRDRTEREWSNSSVLRTRKNWRSSRTHDMNVHKRAKEGNTVTHLVQKNVSLRDWINLKKKTVARKCANTTVDDGGAGFIVLAFLRSTSAKNDEER